MMNQESLTSNAQSWELEVVCKNKEYMQDIVRWLSKDGVFDFGVEKIYNDRGEDRYIVFISCSWFSNLYGLATKLKDIEKKHEKL